MPATILLVDDHPVFRQGLCHLLNKEKDLTVVGEADDGQMAIEQVQRIRPDLVVMDINMPNLDGIEATRQILSEAPETKVVALSVHSGKQFVRDMIQAGASGYILKESIPEEMVAGIQMVLNGDVYLSQSISKILLSDYKALASGSEIHPDESSTQLLYTKLHRPLISATIIPRKRLITVLENGVVNPLTLIAAPAGYGKSILASQWLDVSEFPGAWVSLDDGDNDIRVILSYIIEAINNIFPDTVLQSASLINATSLPSVSVISRFLLNDLESIPKRIILVLDDYHKINNPDVHSILSELLSYPSPVIHLVLITRRDPALPLATLRGRGMLNEITSSQLRFTASEIKVFFERFLHLTIADKTIQILEEKMEGWATGIHLAALSIKDEPDQERLISGLSVTTQYVRDYLIQEVLSKASLQFSGYLLQSSILDRFCAPLCEAIYLESFASNQPEADAGGRDFIDWLVKTNLFVVSLDNANNWFRYHHLFQELLQEHLKRQLNPEEVNLLHSRASQWFETEGLITEAIDHAIAANDFEMAARIVEHHRHEEHRHDRWHILKRWLAKLPDSIKKQRPGLLMAQAWRAFGYLQLEKIPNLIEQAESILSGQTVDPLIQGELNFFRGNILYWEGDAENAQRHFEKALQQTSSVKNSHLGLFLSLARCMCGKKEMAIEKVEEQIRNTSDASDGALISTLIGGPAIIHMLSGELPQAGMQAQRLYASAKKHAIYNHHAWSSYLSALVHFHRYELDQASVHFESALQYCYILEPRCVLDSFAGLMLVQQFQRQAEDAAATLDRMTAFSRESNDPQSSIMINSCRARLSLAQGDLAPALQWSSALDEAIVPPVLFLWLEVPTITRARVFIADGSRDHLAKAAQLLHDVKALSESCRFRGQGVEVGVLQSLLLNKQGHTDEALTVLSEVLTMAVTGGWIRPFVEAGPPMAELLYRLRRQNKAVDGIDALLAAFGDDVPSEMVPVAANPSTAEAVPRHPVTPAQPLVEPLTNRELDVLELLAERLQNKEIADKLFITTETVKGHLKNIYQKLGVSNRRRAIEEAKRLKVI